MALGRFGAGAVDCAAAGAVVGGGGVAGIVQYAGLYADLVGVDGR